MTEKLFKRIHTRLCIWHCPKCRGIILKTEGIFMLSENFSFQCPKCKTIITKDEIIKANGKVFMKFVKRLLK